MRTGAPTWHKGQGIAAYDVPERIASYDRDMDVMQVDVIRRCLDFLEPGGWFLNADLIIAESERLESRIQELRVEGIVRRAGSDTRFNDATRVRAFLDDLEANEEHAGVFWSEHREAVTGGAW